MKFLLIIVISVSQFDGDSFSTTTLKWSYGRCTELVSLKTYTRSVSALLTSYIFPSSSSWIAGELMALGFQVDPCGKINDLLKNTTVKECVTYMIH